MRTALDSSVLLLLCQKQAGWEAWRDCLQSAASEGELLISPIAFAEFSIAYPTAEAAEADLERLHIIYDPITPAAALPCWPNLPALPPQRRSTPQPHPRLDHRRPRQRSSRPPRCARSR